MEMQKLYLLVPLAPLFGAIVAGLFCRVIPRWLAHSVTIAGVAIAAFFLALDFEAIKQGVAMGLPERESWRMSFGLLVTLVWLYLEFLRMFAILSGRD